VTLDSLEAFRRYKRRSDGVIVIRGTASTKVHHPDCPHVREDAFLEKLANRRGGYFWAPSIEVARARWGSVRVCRHPSDPLAGGLGGPEARARAAAPTEPRSSQEWSAEGPSAGLRAVRAEADWALPYEPRTQKQVALRRELRERLRRLAAREDEILHAAFFGTPPHGADVENLVLYNIDDSGRCFVGAARGVRFELSPRPLPRAARAAAYVYRPVPRQSSWSLWKEQEVIATWEATDIAGSGDRLGVWHAFRSSRPGGTEVHNGAFAVSVSVRPPSPAAASVPRLVKPFVDGVVAALQAHADTTTLKEVSQRIASETGRPVDEIARLLADADGAALGTVRRLVHLRGTTVQLSPADDRCVGGELLIEPAQRSRSDWRASCRVVGVKPR
jgi:hypothetical protein